VVWLAQDESLDTQIAIKIMAENWIDRVDLRERFLTEARMLRRAGSSRVVQVFDIGELPDGRPYFVMEFADRGTLEDLTARGPLPLPDALRVTAEVARGVAELHSAGIVHRDLKPSNVLIRSTPDGGERLLIADLGVAKNLAQGSGLTMSVGSAGYMAPEQAEPQIGVDVRADVYSLGALAFHLLTGEKPGPAGQVLPAGRLRAELPPPVRALLAKALQPERERRWPDARSFADALDSLADQYVSGRLRRDGRRPARQQPGPEPEGRREQPGGGEPSTRSRSRSRSRSRWRRAGLGALAVVLLAAAALATFELRRDSSGDVTLHDATGTVSVDVPRSWSGQLSPDGWDPATLGLSGSHAAGLLVTAEVARWGDLSRDVDGVFAGLSSDPDLPATVAELRHSGCTPGVARRYRGTNWSGQVHTWGNCRGGSRTVAEISLSSTKAADQRQVYLQVRQYGTSGGGAGQVDQILDSLKVMSGS
jgi:serine/threonine protein kinase